jgi:hypothetical protein
MRSGLIRQQRCECVRGVRCGQVLEPRRYQLHAESTWVLPRSAGPFCSLLFYSGCCAVPHAVRRGVLLARGTRTVPPVSSGQLRKPDPGSNCVYALLPWDCQQHPCAGGAVSPVWSGVILERRWDALPPVCVWVGVARKRSCMQRVSSGAVRQRWRIAPQLRSVHGWPVLCCARGNVLHPMPIRVHERRTVCHVYAVCFKYSIIFMCSLHTFAMLFL